MSKYEDDWFTPKTGMLANVPLPPRRPPELESLSPAERSYQYHKDEIMRDYRESQRQRFNELKRDYPYGAGYPETAPSFPSGQIAPTISGLNRALGGRSVSGPEDINHPSYRQYPMPPEYEPQRPIPLGEIQRRWGVPRLEDL